MKAKYTMAVLAALMSVAAWAQEDDDMYFNAKDRAVLNKSVAQVMARRYQEADQQAIRTNPVNPSDSYSGRGVNPEYGAQTRNGTTLVQDNPNYFVPSYQPKNLNSSLYGSNSYYNTNPYSYGYNNPYLGYNGYGGMGYGGFGSPYGMYSPYSSMGMGYGWGGMGSGFYGGMGYGMGYGMGSMFSPFGSSMGMGYSLMSMYNPFGMGYGMGYGYSSYYGYPAYGYSGYGTVVESNVVHGRHSVRSSTVNNYVDNSRGSYTNTSNGTTRSSQMGRSTQNNYYDQGWRSNPNNYSRSEYNNYNNNSGNTRSSYNNSWGNSRSSFDSFGSGSRGGFSGGGGGGFSGGGGGHSGGSGGGGGGHSHGRN